MSKYQIISSTDVSHTIGGTFPSELEANIFLDAYKKYNPNDKKKYNVLPYVTPDALRKRKQREQQKQCPNNVRDLSVTKQLTIYDTMILSVGEYLQINLDQLGMSLTVLSDNTGYSIRQIYNLINNKSRLTVDLSIKLEQALPRVTANELLRIDNEYRIYLKRKALKE